MSIKYQANTKKLGTEIPNTNLVLVFSWYTYLPNFWLPIDITSAYTLRPFSMYIYTYLPMYTAGTLSERALHIATTLQGSIALC